MGGILFTAPLQPLFDQIADTFPDILICVFADNTVFLGPQTQVLAAADMLNTLLAAANLALNPIDSNILLTNLPPTLRVPTTMTTQNGLEFPCTTEGLKILGSSLGTALFCQEQFNKTVHKIEQDHILLKDFLYWHQRVKLPTFNVNTRKKLFIEDNTVTTALFITEPATFKLDQSVDNFWTHFIFQPIFEQVPSPFIMNEPSNNYGWEFATAAAGAFVMHHWQLLPHTVHFQSPLHI